MGLMDKVKKAAEGRTSHKDEVLDPAAAAALTEHEKKIEDVLEVLQIPATFEVPDDVFLPDDIKSVDFDIQVPHGFDEGQVMNFVQQSRNSIKFFVALLRQRNEDVAKLASVVDKMQVDANNLRWEQEIANGVNIMPTSDDADMETQLIDARLRIKTLEDQLKAASPAGLPMAQEGTVSQAIYEKVTDRLSLANRRAADLEEENFNLKSRLAAYEDEADDELDSTVTYDELSPEDYRQLGVTLPSPTTEVEEDFVLPPAAVAPRPDPRLLPHAEDEGAFPDYDLTPVRGDHDGNARTLSVYDDDDDSSLEELMRNLRESE